MSVREIAYVSAMQNRLRARSERYPTIVGCVTARRLEIEPAATRVQHIAAGRR